MTKANAKPRVGRGSGPPPTHVSYIFHGLDGACRLQIHERGKLRSRLGFHRELRCANQAEYDAQMDFLIAARVPFMVGHMMPGASDAAYFWLQGQGRRIDYLEISYGGKTEWSVREIHDGVKEWRGVKLDELLGPEIDLFDPANRPRPVGREGAAPSTGATEAQPEPAPEPPPAAPSLAVDGPAAAKAAEAPTPGVVPQSAEPESTTEADTPLAPETGTATTPEAAPAALPPRTPESPGRYLATLSAWLPVLWLGGALWRASGYFQYEMPFYLEEVLKLATVAGLAGGTVYAAAWITLRPRSFARRKDRFELLALSLLMGVMVAFFELMIANVRLDDAPRIAVMTTVTDKSVFKGKYGRNPPEHWRWNLTVEPLQGMSDPTTLRVSRSVWDRAQPFQRIRFHAHPGWLGWVWYSQEEMEEEGFAEVMR